MSADNGVILEKTRNETLKYRVIEYNGEYENNRREFTTLEKAIQFICENCNDTEYGISLSGFEKDKGKE